MNSIHVELVSQLRDRLRANSIQVYYPPEFNHNIKPFEFSTHAQRWLAKHTHCSIIDYYTIFGYPTFPVQRDNTGSIQNDPHGKYRPAGQ